MARDGIKWADCDMHLSEPVSFFVDYIDPAYRDLAPTWTPQFEGDHPRRSVRGGWVVAGQQGSLAAAADPNDPDAPLAEERWEWIKDYINADGWIGPDEQKRAMDVEGIDVAVLFPSSGTLGQPIPSLKADVLMAYARAFNSWLGDFCKSDPARFKHNGLVPVLDVPAAVAEIERCAKLGAVSVFPYISRSDVKRLDNPIYEPIWAAAEANGLSIAFHGARGGHFKERYKDHVPLAYANGRGIEHVVAFSELYFGGVFERHPRLNFVFLEAGCSWALYGLFRLTEIWEKFRKVVPGMSDKIRMPAADYFKRQCYSSVEPEEWTLAAMIVALGDDNFVVSSDFPHVDSPFPEARNEFMAIPNVSLESKKKILWDNCARLYHFD